MRVRDCTYFRLYFHIAYVINSYNLNIPYNMELTYI